MTRLFNDPARFAEESARGFASAFSRWVTRVPGGVVRSTVDPEPGVAVVIGGGSGHYPAFAGLVGPGLAHGAAMGNLFASPSAQQVHAVARAAQRGKGVLLSYGNYAGDVLNFTRAQEQLRAEGIPCETVLVTDDISSAGPDERGKRRGIAGGLIVYKVAGAASARGYSLEDVVRVASAANDRTRSLGVAFSGCTMPGASEPLFTVPEGRMAVGMGIHGEPGIDEQDVPTADGLAQLLVERLLAESGEASHGARRVVPLLNGLGSVKYEEMFVVWGRVASLLAEAGYEIVEPEVGEMVTSFDMAGLSLTLFWPDEELESLWSAPASTPAYRKGDASLGEAASVPTAEEPLAEEAVVAVSDELFAVTRAVLAAFEAATATIDENVEELGRVDAVAGDGDHGIGMQRGVHAALEAVRAVADAHGGAGTALRRAADAWSDRAGGTSGVLWGVILGRLADAVGDDAVPTAAVLAEGVTGAADALMASGGAKPGDKTMVDALVPLAEAFAHAAGESGDVAGALRAAAPSARAAAEATADMLPRMGRARPHAEKSLGTPDAGALSLALVVEAVAGSAGRDRT